MRAFRQRDIARRTRDKATSGTNRRSGTSKEIMNMPSKMMISNQEELKLRRSFEFGAYVLIARYLARNYGMKELRRFAEFWAETAAAARKGIFEKSKEEFLAEEAKIEKAWIGREALNLSSKEYVGIVESCPLRVATNQNRMELPSDFFCDYICSVIYREGYRLLGLHSKLEKLKDGCRVEVTWFS